ncbi:uncharacterized protein LOC125779319 [Bactrocera dorsalis]|uniref:Uncharacterized protein LOC125779319 n=1 Tax=Bactrocera dorsalis TaxID=27457 RepID=A0ABM3K509_BACDO|nr:uncharacterized protein LOC125779319 [Bactrocera dorsalis]
MEQQNNKTTNNNKQTTATTTAETTSTTATTTTTIATTDKSSSSSSTASKSGPGTRKKSSFLDALSPEERAFFEEHARDDDDVPSCSSAQRGKSVKTTVKRANAAPATPSSRTDCGEEGGFTKVESRGERKRRRQRGNIPRTPEPGQPEGQGDPRKAGMSGATLKWYRRFLEDGLTPESAEKRALSRSSGYNPSPNKEQRVGVGFTGAFNGIFFKGGMLLVDCQNEKSATWLKGIIPRLEGWNGPALSVRRGEEIPQLHSMVAFFPRSADKGYDIALNLVRNQNEGLSTSAWKFVSSKGEGSGWNLNITMDDESYKYIRQKGFRLNFRFGKIVVRPWRPKTTSSSQGATTGTTETPALPVTHPAEHEATAAEVSGGQNESPTNPPRLGRLRPPPRLVTTATSPPTSKEARYHQPRSFWRGWRCRSRKTSWTKTCL